MQWYSSRKSRSLPFCPSGLFPSRSTRHKDTSFQLRYLLCASITVLGCVLSCSMVTCSPPDVQSQSEELQRLSVSIDEILLELTTAPDNLKTVQEAHGSTMTQALGSTRSFSEAYAIISGEIGELKSKLHDLNREAALAENRMELTKEKNSESIANQINSLSLINDEKAQQLLRVTTSIEKLREATGTSTFVEAAQICTLTEGQADLIKRIHKIDEQIDAENVQLQLIEDNIKDNQASMTKATTDLHTELKEVLKKRNCLEELVRKNLSKSCHGELQAQKHQNQNIQLSINALVQQLDTLKATQRALKDRITLMRNEIKKETQNMQTQFEELGKFQIPTDYTTHESPKQHKQHYEIPSSQNQQQIPTEEQPSYIIALIIIGSLILFLLVVCFIYCCCFTAYGAPALSFLVRSSSKYGDKHKNQPAHALSSTGVDDSFIQVVMDDVLEERPHESFL